MLLLFVVQELLQELFHSYLSLLVNTRSELAFAHVFNTPDRGLTHHAFTHLKHQAQVKKMSLYQVSVATSLLMICRISFFSLIFLSLAIPLQGGLLVWSR